STSATSPLSLHDALPIYFFQKCYARHVRHSLVGDNHVNEVLIENFQCIGSANCCEYLKSEPKCSLKREKVVLFIINIQNGNVARSEEHTSELQSRENLVC